VTERVVNAFHGMNAGSRPLAGSETVVSGTTMRILKILLALVLLAVVVAGIALWVMPADVGYRYAARHLGPVVLSGVRGTIWDGRADGVSLFGQDLGKLEWRARKASLLEGRFAADVRLQGTDVDVAGTIERSRAGLRVEGMRFALPAQRLAPLFGRDVELTGTVAGVIDRGMLRGVTLENAAGSARWSQAGVIGSAESKLPDLLVDFSSGADGIVDARVRDDGSGPLVVAGTVRLVRNEYHATAELRARDSDPETVEALRRIGVPQPDGASRIEAHGPLLRMF